MLVSNSISVPIDSIIFSLGAFAFDLSWEDVLGIFLSNVIIKYIVTVLSIPFFYMVKERRGKK